VRSGPAFLFALVAAASMQAQPDAPRAGEFFDVTHYALELDLDVEGRALAGRERIDLIVREASTSLVFDSGALTVDAVYDGSSPLVFEQRAQRLIVSLPAAARAGEQRHLEIAYHGAPRTGLSILAPNAQAYTTFSTSHWMIAVDAAGDRATLQLAVTMPAGWRAAGSGRETSRVADGSRSKVRWQQDRPVPSYTFGFVAGDYTEATERHGALTFRYLGRGFSDTDLRTIFRDTAAMTDFFTARAGVPYPGESYTQALGRPVTHVGGLRAYGAR
jgi:aminopeptidase N